MYLIITGVVMEYMSQVMFKWSLIAQQNGNETLFTVFASNNNASGARYGNGVKVKLASI